MKYSITTAFILIADALIDLMNQNKLIDHEE
jgi:hypothetical protein